LARAARTALTSTVPASPPDSQGTVAGVAPSIPTQVRATNDVEDAWVPTQARATENVDDAWAPTQAGPAEETEAWVPTQAGPPEHVQKAWAATQARPSGDLQAPLVSDTAAPDSPPQWPWWRRKAVVIPVGLVMVIGAVATILLGLSGNESARQTGPLDGTFAVEFGSQTMPNGNAPGGSETWVIESACRDGACVATASKVNGSVSTTSTMVLDQTNGGWTAVSASPGTCQNTPAEFWEVMSLQSRPDGNLQGEFIVRSTTGCARNQQVTFTRTGDLAKTVPIAEPQAQPPRVASPAAALRGRYQETDTYIDGGRNAEVNFDIQSYCLRNGQRCLSYWSNPPDAKILVFSQNQWGLTTTTSDTQCQSGGRAHREIILQYPLPQPPQDPITLLTGHGHYTITGDCPFNSDFDSRVQRIGD
jgi:hypothetical protein